MADFTSALYLGMRHPSRSLPGWARLTTGKPAALETPALAQSVAAGLARLQGCDRAVLLPSTLHLFFDLFEVLRPYGIAIFADRAAYPIALWGAERAAARGVPLRRIGHYDPLAARRAIEAAAMAGRRPVILADGFCPKCGRPVPLRDYLACVVPHRGYVVLDDTQALGIWGSAPDARQPYGAGGGGSLRLHGVRSPHVILGSSLAKGFGVPVAVLGGSAEIVGSFLERSETRVHSSPPSLAILHAVAHALRTNALHGDRLRLRLAQLVARFRRNLGGAGRPDNLFPVQMVGVQSFDDAVTLRRLLVGSGIRTVVVRGHSPSVAKLAFVMTALHSAAEIDRATTALVAASQALCRRSPVPRWPGVNPSEIRAAVG